MPLSWGVVNEGIVIDGLQTRTRTSASTQLGERVRQLRVAAGLTQTDLAGDRFSKEYISQIERGKTRPTEETVTWLAAQLKSDPGYLANGVQTLDLARAEAMLAQAEALAASGNHADAIGQFIEAKAAVAETGLSEIEFRRTTGEAWSRMETGEIRTAVEMLVAAESLPAFNSLADVERAEYLCRLGIGRIKLGSTHVALSILTESHKVAEQSLASDLLRVEILRWRSMSLQRLHDLDGAREDIERAIELGQHLGNARALGDALFQASIVALREGRYTLARRHAEAAREKYAEADEPVQLGKVVNNLGGVHFELRDYDQALTHFKESYRQLLDAGEDELCAMVQASIAQVHLAHDNPAEAVKHARQALDLFTGNPEWLMEEGDALHTLGKALLALGSLDEAHDALSRSAQALEHGEARGSLSRTVLAQGDLAMARGDEKLATALYRRSAEMLQDVHF
jgi:tetratricopeptide (TPR) repeat protein